LTEHAYQQEKYEKIFDDDQCCTPFFLFTVSTFYVKSNDTDTHADESWNEDAVSRQYSQKCDNQKDAKKYDVCPADKQGIVVEAEIWHERGSDDESDWDDSFQNIYLAVLLSALVKIAV